MDNSKLLHRIEIALRSGVTSLNLSAMGLTTLPPEIGQLTKLEKLRLKHNSLTTLPPEIGNLTNLKSLNLNYNTLNSLPLELGLLTNLRELHLRNNYLTVIPSEIGRLSNLLILNLINNRLIALPPEIGNLTNLLELYLYVNQLIALPAEIGNLRNLRGLNFIGNSLTTLPSEFGQLTNIQELILTNNQLSTIPPELGKLTNLRWLSLDGNPLVSPPPEIINQGTKATLAYLREQLLGGSKQWVSKLLVVGEGGVGKTSLLRALRGEPFDTQESTTHGIEIKSLFIRHIVESEINMQLNTWDFGGQEIYHATHQFFLTNRSLFLLAWNARLGFEQGKLYYWLDTIKARAPESPVLIVACFIDERDANLPLADLHRKYPQIIGYCEISNKTGAGIESLRREIALAAAKLPLMGETWPTNWLNASLAIRSESKKRNYITPKQLWKLMAQHSVGRDKAEVLATWLHELGDLLYFRDDEELNDTVILNPQWVTQSISKVLESEEVIDNLGVFTRDHMNEIWNDIELVMRDHFLRLMEKFDLSYRTLENRDISLVVERLSFDPPDYEESWNKIKDTGTCNEISMKLELDTTMPAGIPTWFIARSHRFTTRTHWRYGALFADGPEQRHLGLVKSFPHDRYLTLTVRGVTPHNFFALLLDGLELTLKRFPGLNVRRKIPCPGHNGENCTHEFDLDHLQRAIERKPPKLELECPVGFEDVSVPSLLVGLPWSMTNELIAEQYKKIIAQMERISGGMEELRELAQREFTKLYYREQAKIESYCPNTFVLRPHDSTTWLKKLSHQKMQLQLYCQEPGAWHPTERGGLYIIAQSAEWLQTMTPYIRRMFSVLKYSAPLVGPWMGVLSPEHYKKIFENDIKLMEELVKKLPSIKETEKDSFDESALTSNTDDFYFEHVEGAMLRALRLFLDKEDPHQQWGGLKRTLTPEGHYLWLCQHHATRYAQ